MVGLAVCNLGLISPFITKMPSRLVLGGETRTGSICGGGKPNDFLGKI